MAARDENRQLWTLCIAVHSAVLSAVVALASTALTYEVRTLCQVLQEKRSDCPTFVDGLAKRIEQKYAFEFHEGPIIQRKELNATLADTFGRAKLTVVLGQVTAGKTVLVQSWLSGKRNVHHYSPPDGDKLGEDNENACGNEFFDTDTLIKALRKVRKTPEEPAIVAFEINHSTEKKAIAGIYASVKQIVFDSQLPHTKGLIVLSNSYAIDAFAADHGRYKTVWVGDLTEDEAKEFIRVKKKGDADQYIKRLNATGLHLRQLETAARAKSLAAWEERVVQHVEMAAYSYAIRKYMRAIPKGGAMAQELNIRTDGKKIDGDTMINEVRTDYTRVVVYNAWSRRFHWASPQHHQAWSEVVARKHPADKDEL